MQWSALMAIIPIHPEQEMVPALKGCPILESPSQSAIWYLVLTLAASPHPQTPCNAKMTVSVPSE